jgi:hypothetical protein
MGNLQTAMSPEIVTTLFYKNKGLKIVADSLFNLSKDSKIKDLIKNAKKEMNTYGVVSELVTNNMVLDLLEYNGGIARSGKTARLANMSQYATDKFSRMTLAAQVNEFNKQTVALTMQSHAFDTLNKFVDGGLSKPEQLRLYHLGIDKDTASRIMSQFEAHGTTQEGINFAQLNRWDDLEVKDIFLNSLKKEVDDVILSPTSYEKPAYISNPFMRAITNLKSYMFASTGRLLFKTAQNFDAEQQVKLAAILTGGAIAYVVKSLVYGRELSDNPLTYMFNALNSSGIFGVYAEYHNIFDKLTASMTGDELGLGVSRLTGQEIMSYQSRTALSSLAGPSSQLLQDLPLLLKVTAGTATEAEINRAIKLIPLNNHPLISLTRQLKGD